MALRDALDEFCALVTAEGFSLVRDRDGDFNPSLDQVRTLRRFPPSLVTLFEWSNGAHWVKEGQPMPFLLDFDFDGVGPSIESFKNTEEVVKELREDMDDAFLDNYAVLPIFDVSGRSSFGFRPIRSSDEICYFGLDGPTEGAGISLENFMHVARGVVVDCVLKNSEFWNEPIFENIFSGVLYSRLGFNDGD